jgi:hypothetical protein
MAVGSACRRNDDDDRDDDRDDDAPYLPRGPA